MSLIGGIYSDEKCPVCMRNYVDDHQSALRCPVDPGHPIATRFKVKLRGTTARFWNYQVASNYLKATRQALADGVWTPKAEVRTLGHVVDEFLEWKMDLVKMGRLKMGSVNAFRNRLNRIVHVIGVSEDANKITYKMIHDFLYKAKFSLKSTYDSYVVFKEMMTWAEAMGFIILLPKYPPFDFSMEHDMKRRKTVDKETQANILDDIMEHEWNIRPRLYLGVRFLATYISIRPMELLKVNERDYDRELGTLLIRESKTSKRPKIIKLTTQDASLLDELSRGMPNMPLFRHDVPCQGVNQAGDRFGQAAFYRAWKRACKRLGIKGVDLYGGTRHSSAIALYKDAGVSPEEIKKATGHKTSLAFTRYFKLDLDDVAEIHAKATPRPAEVLAERIARVHQRITEREKNVC